ncbi:MAG: RecX family transcriptional regulator [Candidatus Symbiothrix sp.]|jgi:regulatory protein|nr:RecX family transcriptional regulator [Candidatus Symbiothrix sp.]
MKPITYEQALHRLAAYCSRGERCIQDIRQKMIRWELAAEDQKKIIGKLQSEKFLDERRFCKAFVNDKSKYSHWGVYKIQYELKKKQLPESFIREALSEIDREENREQLRKLLATKQKTVKGVNEYEIKQKLVRFAAGKGFLLEDIESVIPSINIS